jgi:hypothetical protein
MVPHSLIGEVRVKPPERPIPGRPRSVNLGDDGRLFEWRPIVEIQSQGLISEISE